VKTPLRLNTRLLPLLVIALAVMQLVDPSRVWMALLVGLGGLWLVCFLWTRSLADNLTVVREIRYGWVQVGDVLEERFTLKNQGWFPATWAELEDHSSLPGYDASLATGVDGMGITQWRKRWVCNRRGLFWMGDTSIHTGDPFGVYSVSIADPARISLMVMPPVVPLPQLEIIPGGYSGEGRPIPHAPETSVEASGVRAYVPGDSLRLVHWKTTARRAEPFVRLLEGTPASDWWVLLDLQAACQAGSDIDSTEEHGVILAASLVDRGLRANRGVGLLLNGKILEWLPPRTGAGQRWEVLRLLALASPGDTSLAQVLEHIRPNLGRNASLIVITPAASLDWLTRLPLLVRRGIRPTVFLLDLHSFDPQLDNTSVATELRKMDVTCHTIPRQLLDRPEAHPGTQGQWEWRVSPLGRAIPVRAPEDHRWRRLAK
jgi:uncharacterized protein (DUF58 family)